MIKSVLETTYLGFVCMHTFFSAWESLIRGTTVSAMHLPFAGIICLLAVFVHPCVYCDIQVSTKELIFPLGTKEIVQIKVRNFDKTNVTLYLTVHNEEVIDVYPLFIPLKPFDDDYNFSVVARKAGHSEISGNSSNPEVNVKHVYLVANVHRDKVIDIISQISGWIYFITWALSYYPQIYINFRRKSVIGFSFDYLALNMVGYVSFGIFIQSLFFAPAMQEEYFETYSRGLIPVKVNDVFYNLHGICALLLTVAQCFYYESGKQTISMITRLILGAFGIFYLVLFILRAVSVIQWLTFLYYASYVKLVITVLKYIPQAYLNYKRKSTSGWSIGVVNLNLAGGVCSIGQMILDSYNYNDWASIFGNPTKFGLGAFTVLFQVLFMVQHYILYRKSPSKNRRDLITNL